MESKRHRVLILLAFAEVACAGEMRGALLPPTYACPPMQRYEHPPTGLPTGNVQVRIENDAGARTEVEALCVILDGAKALPFTESGLNSWVWQGQLEMSGHELALYSYVRSYSVLDSELFDVRSNRRVVPSATGDLNVLGRIEPGPGRTMEVNGHIIREGPRVTWSEPVSF